MFSLLLQCAIIYDSLLSIVYFLGLMKSDHLISVKTHLSGEGRLAAAMKVTISEARKCLRDFSTQFQEATEFKERVQRDCSRQDMTVKTLLGRQRCVTKVYTQALNTVVQGSAADLIKVRATNPICSVTAFTSSTHSSCLSS